jgi:hypothetical protein
LPPRATFFPRRADRLKCGKTLFFSSPIHHKIVILSGAPHRSIA